MTALNKQEGGAHYKDMPIQPIEFITKNKLDWYQGNIVKYASRHHNKGGADDLRKVIHYAELALEAQYGAPGLPDVTPVPETPMDDGWIEWGDKNDCFEIDTFIVYVTFDGYTELARWGDLVGTIRVDGNRIKKYRVVNP